MTYFLTSSDINLKCTLIWQPFCLLAFRATSLLNATFRTVGAQTPLITVFVILPKSRIWQPFPIIKIWCSSLTERQNLTELTIVCYSIIYCGHRYLNRGTLMLTYQFSANAKMSAPNEIIRNNHVFQKISVDLFFLYQYRHE